LLFPEPGETSFPRPQKHSFCWPQNFRKKILRLRKPFRFSNHKIEDFGGVILADVTEPVTFSREIEGSMNDLIVPEEFIKDFHFSTDRHLMIMVRVTGGDAMKVRDFFQDTQGEIYNLETVESDHGEQISGEFVLDDIYMDEGPSLGVDITQEQAMVRVIMDFKRV